MDVTSPEAMQKFADEVRAQETPFVESAVSAFRSLFEGEYKRLRAAQLESGSDLVPLNVTVRCDFANRTVEVVTAPPAVQPRQRRAVVSVPQKA